MGFTLTFEPVSSGSREFSLTASRDFVGTPILYYAYPEHFFIFLHFNSRKNSVLSNRLKMEPEQFLLKDPRIIQIMDIIYRYSDLKVNRFDSTQDDIIDFILQGLKNIDQKTNSGDNFPNIKNQLRLEKLMNVFIRYTQFDFSKRAEISNQDDEIDAIAVCMNVLSEELQASIASAQSRLERVEESNAQIESILENAPNAIIVFDGNGIISKCNKKAEEIFDWTIEEMLHKDIKQLIFAADDTVAESICNTQNAAALQQKEVQLFRQGGKSFPAELNTSVIRTRGEIYFIAFISDITDRKMADQIIKDTNRDLRNSIQSLESFTYSVSHDLRAPLRAIHGFLNILDQQYSEAFNPEARSLISKVINNSNKMGLLIDGLLALSRLDRTSIVKRPINLDEIVNVVLSETLMLITHSKPQIVLYPLPPATGDQMLITQVYTNLISNAIKYSSKQEDALIEIGSRTEQSEIIYFVKDNGAGFDMKFYNKLFGVFQRLHDQQEFEGTGIGLSLVKQIVTKHGGRIWADSAIDKGATFYFTL